MYSTVALIASIICFLMAFYVLTGNYKKKLNQYFFFYNLSLITWSSVDFVSPFLFQYYPEYAIYSARFSQIAGVFIIITMLKLMDYLIVEKRPVKFENFIKYFFYFFGIVLIALSPTDLIIKDVDRNKIPIEIPGNFYWLFEVYLPLGFIFNSVRTYFGTKVSSDRQKKQLQYFLLAIIVSIAALPLVFLLTTISSALNEVVFLVPYCLFVLYTFITSAAIIKHNLFDIRLLLSRGVSIILSVIPIVLIFTILEIIFNYSLQNDINLFFIVILSFISGSFSILLSIRLYKTIYKIPDKLFLKGRINPETALEEVKKYIGNSITYRSLRSNLYSFFYEGLKFKYVDIFFWVNTPKTTHAITLLGLKEDVLYREDGNSVFQHEYLVASEVLVLIRRQLRTVNEVIGVVAFGFYENFTDFTYNDRKFFEMFQKEVQEKTLRIFDVERDRTNTRYMTEAILHELIEEYLNNGEKTLEELKTDMGKILRRF